MQRHYLTIMAAKFGVGAFEHGVRPLASDPSLGSRGDRIAATRKKRAP